MASQTPVAVQIENLPIHRGKGIDGAKADVLKPAKTKRQDRVALRDLSKTGKPPLSASSNVAGLKEKSVGRGKGTSSENVNKTSDLTEEEIRRCQEWAKEGIEQAHFTGNDQRKLEKEMMEKRVKKKVDKVMSALRVWNDMVYDLGCPTKEGVDDTVYDVTKMELVPEELLPIKRSMHHSGFDERLMDLEFDDYYPYVDYTSELKLKVEPDIDAPIFSE